MIAAVPSLALQRWPKGQLLVAAINLSNVDIFQYLKYQCLSFTSLFRLFWPFLFFRVKSETQSSPGHGVKTRHSLPTRQVLVGYWGQTSIAYRVSRPNWEKDLRYFCNNHKFDIYLVSLVHRLFRNNRNRGTLLA